MCIGAFEFAWIMEVNIETTSTKTELCELNAQQGKYDLMKWPTTTRIQIFHNKIYAVESCMGYRNSW